MSQLQKHNLIAQTNSLIEACYKISKNEQLLLFAMISLINPKDKTFGVFSVTVGNLREILDINKATTQKELKKIITRLMSRVIEIKTEKGWKLRQWVSHADLEDNIITLRFHDDLKPYLLELKERGNFTQFRLGLVVSFRSVYTIRMYQLLKEYQSKKIHKFEFSLQHFRDMMLGRGVRSYPLFKDFRKKILIIPNKQLAEIDKETKLYKSDLNFDVETRRTGRKISHLIFTIKTQQTKPIRTIEADLTHRTSKRNASQIILDYEAFGVMRKMVQPYLDQRGKQALQNTLNKFHQDKASGRITKSEQGYLAYLLRVNAGQETTQDKERQQKAQNKKQVKEKAAKEQALKAQFTKEREQALNNFFKTVGDDEREYMLVDFEDSALFATKIKTWLVVYNLYKQEGVKDPALKDCFDEFIINQYLEKTLNHFPQWKEKQST